MQIVASLLTPTFPHDLDLKIYRVHLQIKDYSVSNMIKNTLSSSLYHFPYLPIMTLTFDYWPWNSMVFILSS